MLLTKAFVARLRVSRVATVVSQSESPKTQPHRRSGRPLGRLVRSHGREGTSGRRRAALLIVASAGAFGSKRRAPGDEEAGHATMVAVAAVRRTTTSCGSLMLPAVRERLFCLRLP